MAPCRMRLVAILSTPIGAYLKLYDSNAFDGIGRIETTTDPDEAVQFREPGDALALWKSVSTARPTREDGKPNRPLSAFTVELQKVE